MKDKKYIVSMFPFASGAGLHIGHTVGYLGADIYSRYLKNKGYDVLQPFGFDSFGLPTEQYALKTGKSPELVTEENISNFKQQLNILDLDIDWKCEIRTSDQSYYKWTQWIFLQLYNSWYNPETNKAEPITTCFYKDIDNYRLAYKSLSEVNWCEQLQTVLANDEIDNGVSIRGGYPVIKKNMLQWFLRITTYAERLLRDLEQVEWKNKHVQSNWIGKSNGFEIDFDIQNSDSKITVFTTKPETLKNVEFIVTSNKSILASTDSEGEYFTGYYAIIPFYNKVVPIWVADYVIDGYGTSYVMGVPCDDKRDKDFALKHNIVDIENIYIEQDDEADILIHQIMEKLTNENIGREKTNYKLHDIIISRQRKWGEPIPIEGETDTMASWAGSNWYFFRYIDNTNDFFFCDLEKQKQWLPVDLYVGGSEHTTGHVLYARFITKFLFDLGYSVVDEPFKKIVNVGLMMGSDGLKMSKSGNNSVTPDEIIEKWGVDAYRLWISFIAPFEQTKIWKEDGIKGCSKFLRNFEHLFEKVSDDTNEKQNKLIEELERRVSQDIEKFSFNTAVPRFMTFCNEMSKFDKVNKDIMFKSLEILSPFTPSFVEKIKNKTT